MNDKLPISAFIIAHNEADRIARTIESVRGWVDEVIVIDSGSSDNTVEIAQSLGARTLYNKWPGYGEQKRFGEDQCRNRWLLNLDADEEITPPLAREIAGLFQNGEPEVTGYIIPRRELLPGESGLAPFIHTNSCLRLYNRENARFSDSPVHDSVIVYKGSTQRLKQSMLHYTFRDIAHALRKLNSYSSAQAENLQKRGMKFAMLRLFFEFPAAFFKDYILRLYILRGWRGFVYSVIYAFWRFVRVAKYLEQKKSRNLEV
jgi:glycosyltransferase involved in cell wall biosynthesis